MILKMKNKNLKLKIIVICSFAIPIFLTFILRLLDITRKINISGDAWLGYIGNIIATFTAIIGITITLYKFFEEEELKNMPSIIIKKADKYEYYYWCENRKKNYTHSKSIYIEIINKGTTSIKFPQIKNSLGIINNIHKADSELELDLIEPTNLQTNNKYIVEININYCEGMSTYIIENFEFICTNINNHKYSIPFEVEIQRYNQEEYHIYQKEITRLKI